MTSRSDRVSFSPAEERFMAEALRLSLRGRDGVAPNPMVGALVVRDGRVIGRGYHRRYGGSHAEVEALSAAGSGSRGCDLYVTLEPCAHHGKTPPCTDAIIRAGVSRVLYAANDPNPATARRGPAVLRRAGLAVSGGLLDREAREVNRAYFHWRATGRPWVILKWAMTLDGKIATRTGESRWITGPEARAHAHRLRRRAGAVMVGTTTALRDDPLLLARPALGRVPVRIVLDRRGRLPLSLKLLAPGAVGRRIYVTSTRTRARRLAAITARGLEVLRAPESGGRLSLHRVLAGLGKAGVGQLLVEGGSALHGSFLDAGLAQEVAAFLAPLIVGGARAPAPTGGQGIARLTRALRLEAPVVRRLGEDLLVEGRLRS
jgi:diaminohydroxyphosphoribosylaminopyrimidine deaminase/5-amino-6-(5-phosphoribosylamino)uracil reductase